MYLKAVKPESACSEASSTAYGIQQHVNESRNNKGV